MEKEQIAVISMWRLKEEKEVKGLSKCLNRKWGRNEASQSLSDNSV